MVTVGLVLTALGLGLRHGFDWDHIAAISDLTGTAENRRRGFFLSLLYAAGHAAVVFALGGVAILVGAAIPDGADRWMGRVVGVTLIWLGIWVVIELARRGRDFRLQSRWMLVINGTFAGLRKVRGIGGSRHLAVEHEHQHEHSVDHEINAKPDSTRVPHDHAHALETDLAPQPVPVPELVPAGGSWRSRFVDRPRSHSHPHTHQLALPTSATAGYGSGTATGIGMLHGVGVESPTQIAIFVASTSVVGSQAGVVLLLAWVVGLMIANAGIAALAGFGVLQAERNFGLYRALALVIAAGSIAMGIYYLLA